MIILNEQKQSKRENAQNRSAGQKAGRDICERFINMAYRNGDIFAFKDAVAGFLDGCNEVILRHVDNNKFSMASAHDVLSRMSIALDDSFTEILKLRG